MGSSKIVYGTRVFEQRDIKSGNCYLAVSLLSDSLEMNTLDFEVESYDTTLTTFTRNAPLTYYSDDEQVGIFFVQKVKRIAKTRYSFECTSAMGLLDEMQHYGGIYTGETVADVIADICGKVAYRVKTNLKRIALYGYLPKATARENLSQVLFAIGAAVKSDLDGYLRIEGLWDEPSSAIDENHVYAGGSVEANTPVTRVVVTEHQYIKGTESKTLFEGTTEEGDLITFDEPMHDLAAEGFTILESGVNYAKVSTGNGTLTGTAYIHSTREVSKDVTPAEIENVVRVEDATLVSLANANAVAERLAAYYAARETVEQDVVYGGELPGDVSDMAHPYGGQVQSCIESADITLSGRLRSTERHLVGYVPPSVGESEYYDFVELITEDGEWMVPEGVSNLRVVLIGGGQGGYSGFKGEDGESSRGGTAGGAGGSGGQGGAGGKILQSTLEVDAKSTFSVRLGKGGMGAVYSAADAAPGEAGTETVFGSLTSDKGASSDFGFVDPFSGQSYAVPGSTGISGGKGGDGLAREEAKSSEDGQSVGEYQGGKGAGYSYAELKSDHRNNAFAAGGAGGGAAMGENGSDGGAGDIDWIDDILGRGPGWLAEGGAGGNGGNAAISPPKPIMLGQGGTGGNGGGGGGGTGYARGKDTWTSSGGTGGAGSNGGDGADGCVLIYYRIPGQVSSGRFVTRDGRDFTDNHKRQVVV